MRPAAPTLAFALLIAAAPAAGQIVINGSRQASASQRERVVTGGPRGGWSGELRTIERRAGDAREAGEIGRREARAIRRQAGLVRSIGARYAAGGLSDAELDMLEAQAFALRDLARAPARPVPPRRGR